MSHGDVTYVYIYISMTTTRLLRHLTAHIYSGSIREYYAEHHNIKIDKDTLINNTTIIDAAFDKLRLHFKETIHIQTHMQLELVSNPDVANFFLCNISEQVDLLIHSVKSGTSSLAT